MNIIKTTLKIGATAPFKILHMSDTHLTETDSADSAARVKFAGDRRNAHFKTGYEDLLFAKEYIKKTGYKLIHTGDLVDFITPENLRLSKEFSQQEGVLFIAGNHEIHTCPNNVFCDEDFKKDLEKRKTTLNEVNGYFSNDIDFFCEEINGVYLIGINNYDYQISKQNLLKLKEIASKGLPCLVFAHIPLYNEELYSRMHGALLSIPEELFLGKPPFIIYEQKADETTREAVEFINNCEQIKCFICGHLHFDYESAEGFKKQLITGVGSLREITVE